MNNGDINKVNIESGIGVDALPVSIRNSFILTGDNLVQLASIAELPFVDLALYDDKLKNIFQYYPINPKEMEKELHYYAQELLNAGKLYEAWQVLLALN